MMNTKERIREMEKRESQILNDDLCCLHRSLHYIDCQFQAKKSENNEQHNAYAVFFPNYMEDDEEKKKIIDFLKSQSYKVFDVVNPDYQRGDLEKCLKKENFLGSISFFKSTEETE